MTANGSRPWQAAGALNTEVDALPLQSITQSCDDTRVTHRRRSANPWEIIRAQEAMIDRLEAEKSQLQNDNRELAEERDWERSSRTKLLAHFRNSHRVLQNSKWAHAERIAILGFLASCAAGEANGSADESGYLPVCRRTMAETYGMSDGTFGKAINKLEKLGKIQKYTPRVKIVPQVDDPQAQHSTPGKKHKAKFRYVTQMKVKLLDDPEVILRDLGDEGPDEDTAPKSQRTACMKTQGHELGDIVHIGLDVCVPHLEGRPFEVQVSCPEAVIKAVGTIRQWNPDKQKRETVKRGEIRNIKKCESETDETHVNQSDICCRSERDDLAEAQARRDRFDAAAEILEQQLDRIPFNESEIIHVLGNIPSGGLPARVRRWLAEYRRDGSDPITYNEFTGIFNVPGSTIGRTLLDLALNLELLSRSEIAA